MLGQIASLPILPVPGSGQQSIQPIHIDLQFRTSRTQFGANFRGYFVSW
jgi:hypothetical protein